MMYLHIEFRDGAEKKTLSIDSSGDVRVVDGVLKRLNGDGSYRERGKVEAWPLDRISHYWITESREG